FPRLEHGAYLRHCLMHDDDGGKRYEAIVFERAPPVVQANRSDEGALALIARAGRRQSALALEHHRQLVPLLVIVFFQQTDLNLSRGGPSPRSGRSACGAPAPRAASRPYCRRRWERL